MRFPMCTIMVKDKTDHGVPVAFIITSSGSTGVYKDVLNGLREHVGVDIQPLYILVDDAIAEINAIEQCEWGRHGARVALCTWHVKRSWLKHLISKVKDKSAAVALKLRSALLEALGKIVSAEVRMSARRAAVGCPNMHLPHLPHLPHCPLSLTFRTRRPPPWRWRCSLRFLLCVRRRRPPFSSTTRRSGRGRSRCGLTPTSPVSELTRMASSSPSTASLRCIFLPQSALLLCSLVYLHSVVRPSRANSVMSPRRRSLTGKRIDWLIHVMYTQIFPYYALKTARNTRQADQRAAAVYVHEQLLPAAAAGGGRAVAPPLLAAAAGSGAAAAGAEAGALVRSSAAAASGVARQARSFLALFDQAKDAAKALLASGMPPAVLAPQAALMKTVLRSLTAAAVGSAPAAPSALVAIPGDNSQKRKDPAALGGRSRSYQPRAPPPAVAAPTPLVAAPSTKKRKAGSTMQSLQRKGRADAAGEAAAAAQAAKVASREHVALMRQGFVCETCGYRCAWGMDCLHVKDGPDCLAAAAAGKPAAAI